MAVDREPANGLTKDAVSGLSLADVGISRFAGAGKVYDLNSPSEFPESMGRSSRLFAIAGGTTKMSMKESRWRDGRQLKKQWPKVWGPVACRSR